jgi:hypothetical protein
VSLRTGIIEVLQPGPKGYVSLTAEDAVDRILDYLQANADEWIQAVVASRINQTVDSFQIPSDLIAALRIQENQP